MKEKHSLGLSYCLNSLYSCCRKTASMRIIWPTVNIEWDETCLKSAIYFLQATKESWKLSHMQTFLPRHLSEWVVSEMLVGSGFHERELCVEDCPSILFTKQSFELSLINRGSSPSSLDNANISLPGAGRPS